MNFFHVISRSGSHYKMGLQTGKQAKALLIKNININLEKLKRMGATEEQWLEFVYACESCFNRYAPQLVDELRGIADGSGAKYENVLINSMAFEFTSYFSAISKLEMKNENEVEVAECTAFGVTGLGSLKGETIIHQNVDSAIDSSEYYVVMRSRPSNGNEFISSNPVGSLPYNGLNEKGLCFGNNGVGLPPGKGGSGLPVLRKIAIILEECSTVDEALDIYTSDRGGFSGWQGVNSMIGDIKGELVQVGITHKRFNITDASDEGIIASTNHFHDQEMEYLNPSRDKYISTYLRYERAIKLLERNKGKINLAKLREFASDHKYGLKDTSICRHGPKGWTYASIELLPLKKTFWISYKNPCLKNWRAFNLG